MFDDELDPKNYLINKRSVKLVLIWIVKIAILKIFINNLKELFDSNIFSEILKSR